MNNLVFCTDLHLNFVTNGIIKNFATEVLLHNPSALVIAGDISECPTFNKHMRILETYLDNKNLPIYFVCGNHDYYRGSIEMFREMLARSFNKNSQSIWLPNMKVLTLAPGIALMGHDGWYDGRYADWFGSSLILNDFNLITEFVQAQTKGELLLVSRKLAQESADYFRKYLPRAFANHNKVFLVTHVSPWKETTRGPDSAISGPDYMPYFSSKASGDAILEIMKNLGTEKELIVLAGHSHTRAEYKPLPNIHCIAGQADYGTLKIADVFKYRSS